MVHWNSLKELEVCSLKTLEELGGGPVSKDAFGKKFTDTYGCNLRANYQRFGFTSLFEFLRAFPKIQVDADVRDFQVVLKKSDHKNDSPVTKLDLEISFKSESPVKRRSLCRDSNSSEPKWETVGRRRYREDPLLEYRTEQSTVELGINMLARDEVYASLDPSFNFFEPIPKVTDIVLTMKESIKVHYSKSVLIMYSGYFQKLLGEDIELHKEIALPDIDPYEFVLLLCVIGPPLLDPKPQTVELLINLGEFFEIKCVVDKCENYLLESQDVPDSKKLLLADKYPLPKLKNFVLLKFRSLTKLKELKKSDEFGLISELLHMTLYHNLLE